MDCPAGYTCAGGYYPQTIIIPPGTISITVPNDGVDPNTGTLTSPFSQSLSCCNTAIAVQAPTGTSLAALESLIIAAFQKCAAAKAACQNLASPHPGVPAPRRGVNRLKMAGLNLKACLGTAYSSSLLAQNATGRVFWQIMSGALPTGLALEDKSASTVAQSQSLGISGTPTIAGNYDFTIQMSDSLGFSLTKTFTISVLGITNSPPTATVGSPYSFQFTADGGTGPYTYSVLAAALPLGLTLSASGLLSGTPQNGDQNTFIVTVADSAGQACQKQFVMTPQSNTCALNIAAIVWHDISGGCSASGGTGAIVFSIGSVQSWTGFGIFGTITNNTGADYTIHCKMDGSGHFGGGGGLSLDVVGDGFVNPGGSPFSGVVSESDLLIPNGQSVEVGFFTNGFSGSTTAAVNATCAITCV